MDKAEKPNISCNLCNYDRHVCHGCGTPVTHEQGTVCAECRTPQCGATGQTAGGWNGFCFLPRGHEGEHMDVGI